MNEFLVNFGEVLAVCGIAMALLQCFFGYKLLKFWVALIGFVIGFVAGFAITTAFIKENYYVPAAIGLVVGILFCILAFRVYTVAVFVLCGIIAAVAVLAIPFPDGKAWEVISMILGILVFVVAGILSVKFLKPSIIIVTAVSGAMNALDGLKDPVPFLRENQIVFWIGVVVLAAAGIFVQFKNTAERRVSERVEPKRKIDEKEI